MSNDGADREGPPELLAGTDDEHYVYSDTDLKRISRELHQRLKAHEKLDDETANTIVTMTYELLTGEWITDE